MKIAERLPRFDGLKTLIVLTGNEIFRFLEAKDGEIEEKLTLRVHPPNYPDREGYFIERAGGLETWGPFDIGKDNWKEREFLIELRKNLDNFFYREDPDEIYLFSPEENFSQVVNQIPKSQKLKIKEYIKGNYVKRHPFEVLEKIKSEVNREIGMSVPVKKEAQKILAKPRQK